MSRYLGFAGVHFRLSEEDEGWSGVITEDNRIVAEVTLRFLYAQHKSGE
ncbi:MAG: hypothetical protein J1F18_14605 [Lachnospiraceae bacterium]|nr:hypothetical protein [Lachnospiraceae bacterium]